MINLIWAFFILIGIIYSFLTNNLSSLNNTILTSGKIAFDMVLDLLPLMAIWLGIMNIASKSGLLEKISKLFYPLFSKLFPEIPKNHEALGYITSNIVVNMFGLGNAATPFGLKAMKSLQELNNKKDCASRSMITFLVLNTTGITIVPTTIISLRLMHGSIEPTKIVFACIIATTCSTVCGLMMDNFLARRQSK